MDRENQIDEFLSKREATDGISPDEPMVPFRTSLQLTRDQESAMVDRAMKRIHDMEEPCCPFVAAYNSPDGGSRKQLLLCHRSLV